MSAWLREIAGWVLLGTGLAMFAVTYAVFLLDRRVVEAVIFGFGGLAVFRGGLQLLKVAMAARASRDIRREIAATAAPTRRVRPQLGSQHPHGRPRKSVLPGPAANGDR
jgi:hypothetical protein